MKVDGVIEVLLGLPDSFTNRWLEGLICLLFWFGLVWPSINTGQCRRRNCLVLAKASIGLAYM